MYYCMLLFTFLHLCPVARSVQYFYMRMMKLIIECLQYPKKRKKNYGKNVNGECLAMPLQTMHLLNMNIADVNDLEITQHSMSSFIVQCIGEPYIRSRKCYTDIATIECCISIIYCILMISLHIAEHIQSFI